MDYRIFTENEKSAISVALLVFFREMDGKSRKSKTLLPVVESAIVGGLTLDELFNKGNWLRLSSVISGLTPNEYVEHLLLREVNCLPIKEEDGWCDDMKNMSLIGKCFHDFYTEICPKGGTWSTDNARLNLEKAIKLHSLQALMSEKSINDAMKSETGESEITCYNYVLGVVKGQIAVDDNLTETQHVLKNHDSECTYYEESEANQEDIDINKVPEGADFRSEPVPADIDEAIFPTHEEMNIEDFDDEWDSEDGNEAFVALMDPREMKRAAILSVVYNYTFEELNELMQSVPETRTLADFVEKLTDGHIDVSSESIRARSIHQNMSSELIPFFINAVRMQGYEMDEVLAVNHDALVERWDFRDEKTRKAHKLKTLIYTHGDNDEDLLNCIADIEKLYFAEA